jgi:hypothetical protein
VLQRDRPEARTKVYFGGTLHQPHLLFSGEADFANLRRRRACCRRRQMHPATSFSANDTRQNPRSCNTGTSRRFF